MTPAQMLDIASEEEQKIVESVFLRNDAGMKKVVFTAPDRRSGCSWVASRIAGCLAARGRGSVCLVDANLRWPALHTSFWLDNTRGLLQAIEEETPIRSYTQKIPDTNLWVLPSGGSVADPHAVLVGDKFRSRISEIAREFHFVLIDAIAMKASPDAGLIGRLTDAAVLILEANATSRNSAMNSKIILEAANVQIAGAVLNKRTYPVPDAIYRYL